MAGVGEAMAANCGEPVPAPKFEVGDNSSFQDELGEERTERFVGVEGGLNRPERAYPDSKAVMFLASDLVLRKAIDRDGTVYDRPGKTKWVSIGQRWVDFPLHVGKTWSFT